MQGNGGLVLVYVVIEVVIVYFDATAKIKLFVIIVELRVAIHALPIEAFLGSAAQLGETTLVEVLVICLFEFCLWHEGNRIKKVF